MTGQPQLYFDKDHAALEAVVESGAVLCTIVGIEGSFSRGVGAHLAVLPDGAVIGSLSDNCLDKEVAAQAISARSDGKVRHLRYGQGSPFLDFRLPCGSGIDILIDPEPDRLALKAALLALENREESVTKLPVGNGACLSERRYLPPPMLHIFGTGPEVAALSALARFSNVPQTVIAPGETLALGAAPHSVKVDPWTAIILLFHDHDWEPPILNWALATPAFYIGAQGGRLARETRNQALCTLGCDASALSRIHSPIGLIPHARNPQTLALSIMAHVIACYELLRSQ